MPNNNDSCDKATGSKNSAEIKVEIKEEIESKDIITNEHINVTQIHNNENDYLSYENFKLKNEEIDLKFECNDDSEQSVHGCETVEVGKQISNDKSYVNSANKQWEDEMNYLEINDLEKVKKEKLLECEVDSITDQIKNYEVCCSTHSGDNNRFTCHSKQNMEIKDGFKCNLDAKMLDDDIVNKTFMMQHRSKQNNSQIFKCQHCTYETRVKSNLIRHIKSHTTFKCTVCSKVYSQKVSLEDHFLKIHKCKGVTKKLYDCDQCSCVYLRKRDLLRHKIKHDITDAMSILKCYQCTFDTYRKSDLVRHVKIHQSIKDFKCIYCSKGFSNKRNMEFHLLNFHKCKDVRKRLYNCNQCSYQCLDKHQLLRHKIKHGITDGIPILKCHQCPFETYHKNSLSKHIKLVHKNIKEFKCSYCSKEFSNKRNLEFHLFNIHKCKDVREKLYNCNQCSYKCLGKQELLRHKIKHGITDGIPISKCHQCPFETYHKSSLIKHIKVVHKNIKDFKCTYCLKEFAKKSYLDRHLLSIHTCRDVAKKLYNCNHCKGG